MGLYAKSYDVEKAQSGCTVPPISHIYGGYMQLPKSSFSQLIHPQSHTPRNGVLFHDIYLAFACKRVALQYTVLLDIQKGAKFQEEGGERRSSYPKKLWTVYNKKILRFGPFLTWNKKKKRSPRSPHFFLPPSDTTIIATSRASHLTWSFVSLCDRQRFCLYWLWERGEG